MPKFTDKTAYIDPEIITQLRTLFGTVPNVHRRLGLYPVVSLPTLARAFSMGHPVPLIVEELVVKRWRQWRDEFLRDPMTKEDASTNARLVGNYYHEACARHPITGALLALENVTRFTLLDAPR